MTQFIFLMQESRPFDKTVIAVIFYKIKTTMKDCLIWLQALLQYLAVVIDSCRLEIEGGQHDISL